MAPGVLRDDSPPDSTSFTATKPSCILSRKRTSDELDTIDDKCQSRSKRLRVAFDPAVHVKFLDENGEKTATLIREEVKQALKQKAEGNDTDEYDYIKQLFGTKANEDDSTTSILLRKYLLGLINNTASLKQSSRDLVNVVLTTEWLARDDAFVILYTRFLGHLASSQGGYIPNILRMLVANFAHISSSAGHPFGDAFPDRRKCHNRVHAALKSLLHLVPSASGSLSSVLSAKFPHFDDSKKAHVEYARSLLKVTQYAPELRSEVLDLITERLIKIDVEVQTDVDELEEDVGDILVQGRSSSKPPPSTEYDDQNEHDWSDDESELSDEEEDPEEQRIQRLRSSVDKMDALLDLLFDFYTSSFNKGSQIEMQSVFDQLLSQFRKTVLPTYRSRHTQFLLFHFAQNTPALSSQFMSSCTELLMDKSRSSVARVSAAAYIASFIARGAHVSSEDVWYAFNTLAIYLETLRREYQPTCHGPDPRKYTAYYATAQALIYIFCFRWRDLLDDPEEFDEEDEEDLFSGRELLWASGVKEVFTQNLFSKLNPLKICAPEIVEEFERISRHLRFTYVHHVIEANKRLRLSQFIVVASSTTARETSLSQLQRERNLQLEAYFPFDPYRLPLSKRWLVGDYNEWKGVPGMKLEIPEMDYDSSDEDSDMEEEEEDIEGQRTETPVDSD